MNGCPTTNRRLKSRFQNAESGILDDPADHEVDLAWLTYQISKSACDTDFSLKKTIPDLPEVVESGLLAPREMCPGQDSPSAYRLNPVRCGLHRTGSP